MKEWKDESTKKLEAEFERLAHFMVDTNGGHDAMGVVADLVPTEQKKLFVIK